MHRPISDPYPAPEPESKRGCLILAAVLAAAIILTGIMVSFVMWRLSTGITDETRRTAQAIAAEFQRTVQFVPEIRVNSTVLVEPTTEILELVTAEKKMVVRHRWSHTWLQSSKSLEIEATFTGKAGFDLEEPFRVHLDPLTKGVSADLPPPKLLALSMSEVRVLKDEDGLWNKLTPEDREKAFAALDVEARRAMLNSGLLAQARQSIEARIRELLQRGSQNFQFVSPTDSATP